MRILIVEDNTKLAGYTAQMFTEEGYSVDVVHDGEVAECKIRSGVYDLVILDIMLPKKDGVAVCTAIRADNIVVPIIMITAKGETSDKVLGLDSGADDYVVKPFEMAELLARARALLRRPTDKFTAVITVRDLVLDSAQHTISRNGACLTLTMKEYAVLEYFMNNVDRVVSREQILEHCWDFAYNAFSNITDVYIKQIRKKLHDNNEHYIQTIRGVGYKMASK